jgi:hypothetical protein
MTTLLCAYVFHKEKYIDFLRSVNPEGILLYVGKEKLLNTYSDVIVCKDLKDNIEEHVEFLSFTAWYAVSKNKLFFNYDLIAIFEYDCIPDETFVKSLSKIINITKNCDIIAALKSDNQNFLRDIDKNKFMNFCSNLDLKTSLLANNTIWYPSTNFVMKRSFLDSFVNFFWPKALEILKNDYEHVKYYHERIFHCFISSQNSSVITAHPHFTHYQLKSHVSNVNDTDNETIHNCHFITYSDAKYRHSATRICNEMINVCKYQTIFTEKDVDDDFKRNSNVDWNNSIGGGFWLWKPYIIHKKLESLSENSCLFYCDSGSRIENANFLKKNILNFIESKNEIYAFQMSDTDRNELQWTSQKVLSYLNIDASNLDGQIHATTFLLKNTPLVRKIVSEWYYAAKFRPDFFTNEHVYLLKHRHDQSVWSCLLKKERKQKLSEIKLVKDVIEEKNNGFGVFKSRARGEESCALSYCSRYKDLEKAFSFSIPHLQHHWENYGKKEERIFCSCYSQTHFLLL